MCRWTRDYLEIKFCKNECKGGVLCPPGTCDICPDVKKKDGEGCCFDSQCDTGLICSNTYKCTAGYDNGVDWREKDGIVIGQIGETPEYAVNQAKKYKSDNTWKNAMCNLGLGEAAKENLVFKSVNSFKQALTDISVNKAGGGVQCKSNYSSSSICLPNPYNGGYGLGMQCTVNSECGECIDDGAWENGYDSSSKKYTCNQANKKLLCFANGGSKRCDFQANSQNPGMLCHHDSQCINSRCLNKEYKTINGFQTYFGRCRKVDIGEYCKKDSDCISNAGCYDGFCNWKPSVVDEGKQCNHRSQCKNFLKCKNDYGIITHGKQISFKK